MAENWNWDEIDNEYGAKFKPYAKEGVHEVKLDKVEEKTTNSGKHVFEFLFEESEAEQYPKVSRFLFSDEKKKFRGHHYKEILKVLGVAEDAARKAIEMCESKANADAVADAYKQVFNKAAQKHPKIKIEVSTEIGNDGKEYSRGEFADPSVHFSNNKKQDKSVDTVPGVEEVGEEVNLDDIPF